LACVRPTREHRYSLDSCESTINSVAYLFDATLLLELLLDIPRDMHLDPSPRRPHDGRVGPHHWPGRLRRRPPGHRIPSPADRRT
jgi:hypothetical protein